MTVDFAFYRDVYRGSALEEEGFTALAPRAAALVAHYKRIYTVAPCGEDSEAMAICAVAEGLAEQAHGLRSASVGSVSVNYQEYDTAHLARQLLSRAQVYLDIYRGCGG